MRRLDEAANAYEKADQTTLLGADFRATWSGLTGQFVT